jgi:hypothetical protein
VEFTATHAALRPIPYTSCYKSIPKHTYKIIFKHDANGLNYTHLEVI